MEIQQDNIQIQAVQGDITKQDDLQSIVNAANAQLRTGGGVAGAIHSAAGYGLEKEASEYAPIKPGEAVITGGHNLPNDHVIHCLGPRYGTDEPANELLADCYKNALLLAEDNELRSIGFPAISTGAFGYPPEEAADVALTTTGELLSVLEHVTLIRFVLFSEEDYNLYKNRIMEIFRSSDGV